MLQQLIALIIILFFIFRLFGQRKRGDIGANEFGFWLLFWLIAALAIAFIKKIDQLVADLGFSGTGIEILFYLAVLSMVYLMFRLRLRMEKTERQMTKIVQNIALMSKDEFKKD